MPNRVLPAKILVSRRVAALSPEAELFYRRLWSVVDDYARYHADPPLLRIACYPLRFDSIRDADVSRWLEETAKAGLVLVYVVDDEPYLELLDFGQQMRAKRSKFPAPPPDAKRVSSTRLADAQHLHPEARGERREAEARARGHAEGSAPRTPPRALRPSESEWLEYARATWPDWPEHDARSAWAHYESAGWKRGRVLISDWHAAAKTCYHRHASEPGRRPPPLVGAHDAPAEQRRDPHAAGAPEWVRETARAVYDTHDRPVPPRALEQGLYRWESGEDPEPPRGWRESLEAAWAAAKADPARPEVLP